MKISKRVLVVAGVCAALAVTVILISRARALTGRGPTEKLYNSSSVSSSRLHQFEVFELHNTAIVEQREEISRLAKIKNGE